MECNKDEATRAKEIAERKFSEKDYAGARRFVLKAQNLYPGLEGLSQMLTTLEVYIAGENKINGEVDWYAVLGVHPAADDETVRRQYRRLALSLHPDKNKAPGADGAFKVVSEAWSLLSDKTKRLAYNQRRNFRGVQQKFSSQTGGPSVPPSAHGSHASTYGSSSYSRTQNKTNPVRPTQTPPYQKGDTFWTICNRCKTHYEYQRTYLNHTLLCPNCHEAFFALEKAPPPNVFKSSNWSSRSQDQTSRQKVGGFNAADRSKYQWGLFSKTTGVGGTVPNTTAAEAASVVHQASEKVKRELEAQQKRMDGSFKAEVPMKKRRMDDIHLNGQVGDMKNLTGMGRAGAIFGNASGSGIYGFSGSYSKHPSQREWVSPLDLRKTLMEKARTDMQSKLKEWNSRTENNSLVKEKLKGSERGNKRQSIMTNGDKVVGQRNGEPGVSGKGHQIDGSGGASDEATEQDSINVPDPDFHNFDSDRTETSFGDDQIWAAYDNDDGMPRFYARIHKVISLKPFKMKISWLNSRTNSELGPMDWVGSGFFKTCGDFRIGRYEFTESLNSFSHKVKWTKGTRGVVCIYPSKGDVWALYKNWSPDWNEETPEEVVHKYEMVEVLDDYNEEQGVSVIPLVKVAGFRTVFNRHTDPKEIRRIPREEMFRFSHQVPTYLLTGEEAENAPKDCLELDPAATSLELLQVITVANEPFTENGKQDKETSHSLEQMKSEGTVEETLRGEKDNIAENDKRTDDEALKGKGNKIEENDKQTDGEAMVVDT